MKTLTIYFKEVNKGVYEVEVPDDFNPEEEGSDPWEIGMEAYSEGKVFFGGCDLQVTDYEIN